MFLLIPLEFDLNLSRHANYKQKTKRVKLKLSYLSIKYSCGYIFFITSVEHKNVIHEKQIYFNLR